tara:strand:- start:620 stop:955 length:336 start_codon:yes stop_codon:yes gene_type:complete
MIEIPKLYSAGHYECNIELTVATADCVVRYMLEGRRFFSDGKNIIFHEDEYFRMFAACNYLGCDPEGVDKVCLREFLKECCDRVIVRDKIYYFGPCVFMRYLHIEDEVIGE